MRQRMLCCVSPSSVLTTVLDAKQFAEKLPSRVNRVLDALARNELKLKVENDRWVRLLPDHFDLELELVPRQRVEDAVYAARKLFGELFRVQDSCEHAAGRDAAKHSLTHQCGRLVADSGVDV